MNRLSILLVSCCFSVFLPATLHAGVPLPDLVLYGDLTVDGEPADPEDVDVIARFEGNNVSDCSFADGRYVLKVHLEDLTLDTIANSGAVEIGNTIQIIVQRGTSEEIAEETYTVPDITDPTTLSAQELDLDVVFPPDGNTFFRGDVDGNGIVFTLLDALYLLNFGFTGGDAPPCKDAADTDGNDNLFALLDALYLLAWGFTNGPAPPDPGPDICGVDPRDDEDVDCEESTCTP